jgi:electron transfer flavoprotein beta subunit
MRIAAVVEQSWDPASIEVDPVSGAIDRSRAAPAPSPGSLEAVELGLGLGETHVLGLGGPHLETLLRECLAVGAASAAAAPDAYALAEALAAEPFDLVLVPHRSGDHGASPVAGLLAGLLDLPQATAVESLTVDGPEARVVRRLDRGEREELAVPLPAVIAVEPGIVRPRVASPAALITAQPAPVVSLPRAARAPRPTFLGHRPPRPAPPRMSAPSGTLSAEARIAAVIGATAHARHSELVTGTADEVARHIVELLEAAGYLG